VSPVQHAALEILYYLDGIARQDQARESALRAVVSAGKYPPEEAWPQWFALPPPAEPEEAVFPDVNADMSEFQWERPTEESFAADLAALVAASPSITIREEPPPAAPQPPGPGSLEWT
jgi:hypothetical protein